LSAQGLIVVVSGLHAVHQVNTLEVSGSLLGGLLGRTIDLSRTRRRDGARKTTAEGFGRHVVDPLGEQTGNIIAVGLEEHEVPVAKDLVLVQLDPLDGNSGLDHE
jgi:fructose-1,6-bisphosphatase